MSDEVILGLISGAVALSGTISAVITKAITTKSEGDKKLNKWFDKHDKRHAAEEKARREAYDNHDRRHDAEEQSRKDAQAEHCVEHDKIRHKFMMDYKRTIVDIHSRAMKYGYIDHYSKMFVNECYDEYKDLDGNSYIDDLMQDINKLPVK